MPQLAEFFQNAQLPTMPEVAQTLIRTLHDEDSSPRTVRDILARDPALTVKLIRLANCARFGLPRTVASLDDAILMTGLGQVRTLALSACLNGAFPVISGLDRKEFWEQSMACAGYADWLARRLEVDPQAAWLAGMMLRLGELVIGQRLPQALTEIERQPHLPGGRWERENLLLGFTESQVSAEMARRWNFPTLISDGLDHASDPMAARPFCRLGGLLHLAELLAETAPKAGDTTAIREAIEALPHDVMVALQLDPVWMAEHLPAVDSFIDMSVLH
ncbi:HDOD domain-containing protein [Curvibacter sp. RS43]|uniref:HDOD domain-containing protein n=1 Tax=Curvibacter microcysteis TaxID=3026419 RepID=A0ABT5MBZ8_9BURK|nr:MULTISPECIES: HDOD domain-containing protein [unclassified Curvibacter]MDD0809029.1 HDOD domain-containing protein [Curvibacter sp. RS43]MDD0814098.1 HDOD domain-containing protein [Curvibacter sp. HBC28]